MSSSNSVTAVFDIGKTNKKFFLFDEEFTTVFKLSYSPDEIVDNDGFPCENLEEISKWMKKTFIQVRNDQRFSIKSLNISAYGASLVHLDKNDDVIAPLYNYQKPYPAELLKQFYRTYGGKMGFSLETASPPLGMLNSGLQLYWLKYFKPDLFKKIKSTLHFPQYLSFLFTGQLASEMTSIGCHTAMWNFQSNSYHKWLKLEGCLDLLPEILPATSRAKNNKINVGPGIHDSSSALVPFFFAFKKPFLLLSTGTWSITLNPYSKTPLTYDELARDCLQYMSIYGKPVKASRFFLGKEYTHQLEKLEKQFQITSQHDLRPDPLLLNELINRNRPEQKLQMEHAHNTGPWPVEKKGYWDITQFNSFKEAYHQLMLDLISIQRDSLKLAEGKDEVKKVVISGGFAKNDFFITLLASFFPGKEIYTSATSNASALGAAMLQDEKPIHSDFVKKRLGLKEHKPIDGVNADQYSWV